MTFFNSQAVTWVFPAAYRTANIKGMLTSEDNFSNMIRSVVDKESYVISYNNNILKLVIYGYYFEIKINQPFNASKYTFAIRLDKGAGRICDFTTGKITLDSGEEKETTLDSDGYFTGLVYDEAESIPTPEGFNSASEILKQFTVDFTDISKSQVKFDIAKVDGLQAELDSKQDNITTSDDLILNDNVLSLNADNSKLLNSMAKNVGGSKKPIYIENNQAMASDATVGGLNGLNYTSMVMSNGELTTGRTWYASTSAPNNSIGKVGDIWFKYTESK